MKKIVIATTLCVSACMTAQAEVRINGFANLIGGMTSSNDTLYGYDDKVSFSEESLFAIQISGDVNDKMTATGQLVARGDDNYEAKFDWAYLTYEVSETVNVSVGRFRLPLFNYSASSEIGYSYHWISTPQTIYDVAFNNIEGIKIDYANYVGDWEYSLSGSYGTYDDDSTGVRNIGNDTFLFSAEAVYDWFKIRGVVGTANITIDLNTSDKPDVAAFGGGLESLRMAGFTELEDLLQIRDDTGVFSGITVQVDKFTWFVSGEYTVVAADDSFAADDVAYYLTAGIRRGKWTPSITYENFRSESEIKYQAEIARIASSPLPDAIKTAFTQLAIGGQLAQEEDYNVLSATIRYDLDTNIALKADISRLSDDVNNAEDATLLRFAVNYVF